MNKLTEILKEYIEVESWRDRASESIKKMLREKIEDRIEVIAIDLELGVGTKEEDDEHWNGYKQAINEYKKNLLSDLDNFIGEQL